MKPIEPEATKKAEIVEVIRTVSTRGNGVDTVYREVIQYWSKEGELLAEHDPIGKKEEVESGLSKDKLEQLKDINVTYLAQTLEDGLLNSCWLDEKISVYDFIKDFEHRINQHRQEME